MENLKRTLSLITASFAAAGVAIVVVLASVDLGEAESPDLANGGALTAAVFGAIGLLVALQWWSRSGETSPTPASLQTGYVIRIAIAELGLLMGILALVMTGSIVPSLIGLSFFLASLLLLALGLRRATSEG